MKRTSPRQRLTWHVAFEWPREAPWGHVMAFAYDAAAEVWIVIDPHFRWTETFALRRGAEFDRWVAEVAARAEIWRIEGRGRGPVGVGWFCVGTVKRLVGVRSGALSPWGLRRDLRRAGARQVFTRATEGPQGRSAHQVGP
jgi:hypothetical protein